jgi:hypothetical protein
MGNLTIPECNHVKVFRAMVAIAKADPFLSRTIKTWVTWDGKPQANLDLANPAVSQCPMAVLTPTWGGNSFHGPDSFDAPIEINIGLAVPGWHADDPLNLYFAFIRAFYPTDDSQRIAIHQRLVVAGAKAHFILQFTTPMGIDERDGPVLITAGRARLDVIESVNP